MDVLESTLAAAVDLRVIWRQWLDPGVFLLAGLAGLFFWRLIIGYGCSCIRFSHLNHIFMMYTLVLGLGVYGMANFVDTVSIDYEHRGTKPINPEADLDKVWWLRGFLWLSPVALIIVAFLSTEQALMHMHRINHTDSVQEIWRHDRAILIIAMPLVFAVMMLNSTVPMYQLAIGEDYYGKFPVNGTWHDLKSAAINLKNGYSFCADAYEAWAFYQFGMLVLELVEQVLRQDRHFKDEAPTLYHAMSDLMWLGPWLFIVVCVAQAGFSLVKQLTGHLSDTEFDDDINRFEVAGFVASSAAIYNVGIVERRFGGQLSNFWPLTKFLSVKILVSLSFMQKFTISAFQTMNTWTPEIWQDIVARSPFLSDIASLSDVQMNLFYPTLVIYECLLAAILHSWAWDANEEWYENEEWEDERNDEEALALPLLGDQHAEKTWYGDHPEEEGPTTPLEDPPAQKL